MEFPQEDELDVIIKPDDPRFAEERTAWIAASKKAQGLLSAEELLTGVSDDDWHVRYESIDRLKARWHDDPRTFPALVQLAERDPKWHVRDHAMMALHDFERDEVISVARRGTRDPSSHVRWSANFVLFQRGLETVLDDYPD